MREKLLKEKIEKLEDRLRELHASYDKLGEICNSYESTKPEGKKAFDIARLMVIMLGDIESVEDLIKYYKKDLEKIS